MPPPRDTIFALSSGRPPAAIAVVRLSGPRAGDAIKALAGRLPEPRRAGLARVRDPASGEIIDEALALWFPGPNSETGEDMAELQLHGGRAVIAAVLGALGRIEGLRPAEAGEFTRRAFENGRLDLTAVEGLADLIGAETEAQRRQAFRQMKGLLGDRAETWRARLIEALALVEARIDFSDEADVPEDLLGPALEIARGCATRSPRRWRAPARGERLRDGLVVAIAGPPNAGKSTLLNRIARREVAIVSPVAGYDPGRDRGASRSRRLSGDAVGHGRHPRQRRSGRAGGCSACSRAGGRSGSGFVGCRRPRGGSDDRTRSRARRGCFGRRRTADRDLAGRQQESIC